ncbi:tRNA pseudouridine(38-40) synthase TruA [Moraxella caviae]|uniref:tRNA pseudouridine synthase A n=1 Tax=Moraxella caviae TaxID=34060 RepID=A0A1S9ZWM3_9GAMM|nr:tRNA pseudouridine(38-40) synthase TruA [Moraxella caviae]OOR87855.1 tRNA pseudouridine(38-40) synthase TruA [Moraxella caviae]STZ14889.1 tRNA pseudouridine synthase A [Moraxella caviae]VEW11202.1 tRNA pseudouridine synthase A [Moraxella caviae]
MSDGAQTYAVGIEFIGTRYRGWQRQEEVVGVQAVLENALSKIANEPIELIAAGRTDAGVHAGNMIAHFTTTAKRSIHSWMRGANTLLPDDVALRWITPMPSDFHARFSAIARRYRYITLNQPYRPALLRHQVTHHYASLDVAAMIDAAKLFVGTHDFSSFRAAACQSNQPVRTVSHADLFMHGAYLVLDIQADGFLHHMVRNLMGALFAVGQGELNKDELLAIMHAKDRSLAPPTASADGLYFINAYYPERFQSLLPDAPLTPLWLGILE